MLLQSVWKFVFFVYFWSFIPRLRFSVSGLLWVEQVDSGTL